MRETLWEKENLNHGHSTVWTIFTENGKIYVDSHVGWVSEAYLTPENEVKLRPINPIPQYIKAKLKSYLKTNKKKG